jgi:hypothetical protein
MRMPSMVRISSTLLIVTARRRCGNNNLPSSILRSVMRPWRSFRPTPMPASCIGVGIKHKRMLSIVPVHFSHS